VKIIPWIVTYNGMGTGPSLQHCVDFLLMKAPRSFGPAIAQVDIYAHCRSRGRTPDGLDFMRDRFRANALTLPKVWFRRKSRLVEIAYFSRLLSVAEMFEEESSDALDLHYFLTFCREFASALLMIEERLKPADKFDMEAFRAHLRERLNDLPKSERGLHRLQARLAR
jgi:hypothetical protein